MEIVFQNKQEDFEAFYHYMLKETEEGKTLSRVAVLIWAAFGVLGAALIGLFQWGVSRNWQTVLSVIILSFLLGTFFILMKTGLKPFYNSGLAMYKGKEKSLTSRDLQVFQLPRTIMIDEDWLEIRSTESVHRWRWRQVDKISITPNFIFIRIGKQPIAYVPKRDFQSEQGFMEFGKKLIELTEKHKDQLIGTE